MWVLVALLLTIRAEAVTPVGHWKLNETSGTSVADSSGNGNTGTVNGTSTWVSGVLDNAFDADYTDGNDFVNIPNSSSLENVQEGSFTVSAWFNPSSIPPGSGSNYNASYGIIIKEGNHTGLKYRNDQTFQMDFWLTGDVSRSSHASGITCPPGEFYHVVGVVDQVAGTNKIYVNGVLYNTTTFTPGTAAREYGTMPWRIGTARDSTGVYSWPADGTIDDVRIYDQALSDQEVEDLYDRLEGHWKFDETSGTDCFDASINERHAEFDDGTPTRVAGIRNNALEFDGTHDVNTLVNYQPPTVGTIAFWSRFTATPSSTQYILGTRYNWEVYSDASGQIKFRLGSSEFSSTSVVANAGEWHHVAVAYSSIDNTYNIYIDGVLDTNGSTSMSETNGDLLSFGTKTSEKTLRFVGDLDDIRIYAQQLSATQIQAIYGVGGHWKFDETSGTVAADSSGSGNDGTYVNGPTLGDDAVHKSGVTFNSSDIDDHVDLPHQVVNGLSTISVAWWMNLDDINRPTIISGANATDDNEFRIYFRNDSAFRLYYSDLFYEVAIDPITTGKWIHFVVQFNRSSGEIHIHRDGVLIHQSTLTAPGGNFEIDPGGLIVGQEQDSVGGGFASHQIVSGTLDDLWIFDRELSDAEIAELYGLVGHWKLNETSGTVAGDSSPAGNDGTVSGTTSWTAGVRSGGLDFTPDSSVEVDYMLNEPADFSMACWVKLDQSDTTGADLLSVGDYVKLNLHNTNGIPQGQFYDGSGYSTINDESINLADDGWHHVAIAFNDHINRFRLYVDGELVRNGEQYQSIVWTGRGTKTFIGKHGNSDTNYDLDGAVDDVRLYNRAISDAEVKELYGLVGHWKLDETSGTVAADSSGAGRNGTHTSGVTVNTAGPYPGKGAVAAEFDGTDDHVVLPNFSPDLSDGFAVSCWVEPESTPGSGDTQAFFNLSNGAGVDEVWVGGVGTVGFQLYMADNADGSTLRTVEDNTDLVPNRWTHYIATVDYQGNATLYRDGVVVKTGFTSIPKSTDRSQTLIAKSPLNDYFPGRMHDVRLYDRPVTAHEVAELYGMVGHWTFDEGTGTTIADSSLNGNDASFNAGNPAWVDGAFGYALEFDGTNDARTDAKFDPPESGAVSLWIRTDGTTATRHRPWGVGADYEMWQDSDGLISMDVGTDGYQGGFITTERFDDGNRWYHIVAQYDSDTEEYEIYIDGQLHKSGVSTQDIKKQSSNFLTFGTRTFSSQRFVGALDDFRVFNRKLHIQEIARLYGILGHWKFDELSGTVAADSSGAGNDGEYVDSPVLGRKSNLNVDLGTSVQLDGTNHIRVPGLLGKPANVTAMGWVRLDSIDNDGAELVSLGDILAIRLDRVSSTPRTYGFGYDGGSWDKSGVDDITTGTGWKHFATTYDDHRNQQVFYINGIEVANESQLNSLDYTSAGDNFVIGTHGDAQTNLDLTGRVDDVRLYSRALTPEEIRDIYGSSKLQGLRIIKWVEVR